MDRIADRIDTKAPDPVGRSDGLADALGRRFEYLRLSLTDMCNFRCTYCLPDGYRKARGAPPNLTLEEIVRLVRAFATLGLWKIRLTGGEPTLRKEFTEIASAVSSVPGISRLAMTTNGYRLPERAQSFYDAGVRAINISIDSLDAAKFKLITGHARLEEVLDGIEAARAAGIPDIKINTVLMRDLNHMEIDNFLEFVAARDISLRFIEVMRTNDNPGFFKSHHLPGENVTDRLEQLGWTRLPRVSGAGPAVEYGHPDAKGRIGIIAPYSKDFCASCNRLRVSATGKFHLCLFGDGGIDLRPFLASDDQHDELVARIIALTMTKAPSHLLHQGNSGATPHLASIGG